MQYMDGCLLMVMPQSYIYEQKHWTQVFTCWRKTPVSGFCYWNPSFDAGNNQECTLLWRQQIMTNSVQTEHIIFLTTALKKKKTTVKDFSINLFVFHYQRACCCIHFPIIWSMISSPTHPTLTKEHACEKKRHSKLSDIAAFCAFRRSFGSKNQMS